jgi:hypothetical protein
MKGLVATAKKLGVSVGHLNNHKIKYDGGKYAPGCQHKEQPEDVKCILWYEHRKDSHGPYIVFYTINDEYLKG